MGKVAAEALRIPNRQHPIISIAARVAASESDSLMKCQFLRLAACAAVLSSNLDAFSAEPSGVLPKGPDGQPLNSDFEQGSLKDWTATGDAFDKQPVKGDTVNARRSDMKSQHQGEYWVGT